MYDIRGALYVLKQDVLNEAELQYRLGSRAHLDFLRAWQAMTEAVDKLIGGEAE